MNRAHPQWMDPTSSLSRLSAAPRTEGIVGSEQDPVKRRQAIEGIRRE